MPVPAPSVPIPAPARSTPAQIAYPDGRIELAPGITLTDHALVNDDLAPTAVQQRTWTTYNYAALWISMAHCIPTYMMASGLMASGMNGQAFAYHLGSGKIARCGCPAPRSFWLCLWWACHAGNLSRDQGFSLYLFPHAVRPPCYNRTG